MAFSGDFVFRVNRQLPNEGIPIPPQPQSIVLNYRKPGARRRKKKNDTVVQTKEVELSRITAASSPDSIKRKRSPSTSDVLDVASQQKRPRVSDLVKKKNPEVNRESAVSKLRLQPTKLRCGRTFTPGLNLDCWYLILGCSDPPTLLEYRDKIAFCFRFLNENKTLWKTSRLQAYGDAVPDPLEGMTEFRYAQLRHGHGCMGCGAPSVRKTYWPFLRRFCKNCYRANTIKEDDAKALMRDRNGKDISFLTKCISSGAYDSWGNFIGVGPIRSMKTNYLLSDVIKVRDDYIQESKDNPATWHAEQRTWIANKENKVTAHREFARKLEKWEDSLRQFRNYENYKKKTAREKFFVEKAKELDPPLTLEDMSHSAAYRRSVAIPKDPNMLAWLTLKPKMEKEVAEFKANGGCD